MGEVVTHSQRLSITLRCLATGNNLKDLIFVRFTCHSIKWNYFAREMCLLLGRQTAAE